ncbi:protein-L-isoaspartate O-methyltransferase family protein [Prosthecomicrobium sp. N25]|uniref:protein-L-isoaspartate O-methyltransferase family protein n=1 Tax=Prosthecomicrobium sp. N25 TaxID=3129254 RepID=UPI00307736ED
MTNFAKARRTMVDNQLRTNDVTDLRILDAFDALPRELFVPRALAPLAYIDEHLQVKAGPPPRYLMQPAPLARLIQLAAVRPGEKVLVVGAGTGYAAALLARLDAKVIALESDPDLAAEARKALAVAGAADVEVVTGPLAEGVPAAAPFDVILLDGSVEVLPESLGRQLAEGGRLVAVEGRGLAGKARIWIRTGDEISPRMAFNCAARPLPGFEKVPAFEF